MHPELTPERHPPFEKVLAAAFTGEFRNIVRDWIDTAAVAHIADWRLDESLRTELSDEDFVLPGGLAPTTWVYDRFTKNYLSDWTNDSLAWELSYLLDPDNTSAYAGVDSDMLARRPTSAPLVLKALQMRHNSSSWSLALDFGGLSLGELRSEILHLVSLGDVKSAQYLAGEASRARTDSSHHRMLHAFTLIPTHPEDALSKFETVQSSDQNIRALVIADTALCHLVGGRHSQAIKAAQEGQVLASQDLTAWLWVRPENSGSEYIPKLEHVDLQRWFAELLHQPH